MSDLESRLRAALQDETIEVSARSTLAEDMVQRGTTVRRRRRLAGGFAGLVVLAAIVPVWHSIDTSSDSGGPVQQPTVTQPSTPATSSHSTSAPPTSALPPWSTAKVEVTHLVRPTPKVVDVRAGTHGRYDRIVFDLAGPIPGYTVRLGTELVADGSGETIPVPGPALLVVTLEPAQAHDARGGPVLDSPAQQSFDFPMLRGVVLGGDFEGHVTFGVGLAASTKFRVLEVRDPNRLVIDVHH